MPSGLHRSPGGITSTAALGGLAYPFAESVGGLQGTQMQWASSTPLALPGHQMCPEHRSQGAGFSLSLPRSLGHTSLLSSSKAPPPKHSACSAPSWACQPQRCCQFTAHRPLFRGKVFPSPQRAGADTPRQVRSGSRSLRPLQPGRSSRAGPTWPGAFGPEGGEGGSHGPQPSTAW